MVITLFQAVNISLFRNYLGKPKLSKFAVFGFRPQFATEVMAPDYLRNKLLEYVGNGNVEDVRHMQDAEIGQRIYAAIQMVRFLITN